MANLVFKVIGHLEVAGIPGKIFGNRSGEQYLVSAGFRTGINYEGYYDPDPVSVNSVLASNGKVPSGAVFVIDSWGNVDHEHQGFSPGQNQGVNILF
jgi:hypothetical protein